MPPEQMPVDNSPEFEALLLQNDENAQVNQNQLDSLLMQGEEGNNELKSINKTLKEESEKVKKVQVVLPEDENELAQNFFKMLRGPKGKDGYSPVKGKDYYTKEEIAEVVKEIQDSIRIPEDGLDGYTPVRGEDYFTDEDISSMVDDVFSRIPTPKDGKDAEVDYEMIISECVARIPKPKNGKNGKNSAEMTSEQILDKIRGLLSYNDLKDLPTLWKNVASRDYDLTELKDVSITSPTNGQVLKYNSTTRKWTNDTDTGGAPGGSDTEVQFNDGGSFGGDAGLSYNKTTDTLTIGTGAGTGTLVSDSLKARGSGGLLLESSNGTDVLLLGAGSGSNATFYGGVNIAGDLTVDTNTLHVDSTNNRVGVGTTTPSYQFESDTSSNSFNLMARRLSTTTSDYAAIGLGVSSTSDTAMKGGIFFERTASNARGSLHLAVNGTNDASVVALSNARLTIDSAGLIGLGTTSPTHTLTLPSTSTGIALYNTADQTTNYERGLLHWSSNILILRAEKAGSGGNRNIQLKTSSRTVQLSDSGSGDDDKGFFQISNSTSSAVNQVGIGGTYTNSSGVVGGLSVGFTANQSGTAGYNALKINITETATGSGTKRLISAQVGSVDKFVVDNAGNTTVVGNIIATKQIYYAAEIDNGNSGASDTIDWTLGNLQKSTITADCTYSFTAPTGPCHLTLRIIQDGTGNWTATLPSGKWASGIVPLIKDTASKWSILSIYYDGSAYSYSLNANLS